MGAKIYSASGDVLFGNAATAVLDLASGATCSCVAVSNPSANEDESPIRGLGKVIGASVGRLFVLTSEGDDDNWEEVGSPT